MGTNPLGFFLDLFNKNKTLTLLSMINFFFKMVTSESKAGCNVAKKRSQIRHPFGVNLKMGVLNGSTTTYHRKNDVTAVPLIVSAKAGW